MNIDFYLEHRDRPSFDPVDSDSIGNFTLMKHLVSTLVRYKSGGQFEPYLASEWNVSDERKTWTFHLRPNLICEDGTVVTAEGYKSGLLQIFRAYLKSNDLPIFVNLVGWDDFKKGDDHLAGIETEAGNKVRFRFASPASEGFLEYLSMAYFGYLCPSNFENGKWRSNSQIFSSGPYKVLNYRDNEPIGLQRRDDWALVSPHAPLAIRYHWNTSPADRAQFHSEATIVQRTVGSNWAPNGKFTKILGAPDNLTTISLDVGKDSVFRDPEIRQIVHTAILRQRDLVPFDSATATRTDTFFINQKREAKPLASFPKNIKIKRPVKIFSIRSERAENQYSEKVLTAALDSLGIKYEFSRLGEDPHLREIDKTSREKFDIRITSVYSGAGFDAWVVEMMFCSNMGISLPDPSGNLCHLIKQHLAKEAGVDPSKTAQKMWDILENDASVIPLFHQRVAFYITDDFDLKNINPDAIDISFDDLRLKD